MARRPRANCIIDTMLLRRCPCPYVNREKCLRWNGIRRRPGRQDGRGDGRAGRGIGPVEGCGRETRGGKQGVDTALGIEAGVSRATGELGPVPGGALPARLQGPVK